MNLKQPSDIPSHWPKLKARKRSFVSIREAKVPESFKVSWQDSELVSDPVLDLIIIQSNGTEYPCKKDIFYATYQEVENFNVWQKKELSTLVQIPPHYQVSIETLEGTLNKVVHPDYIVIGKKDELYANKKEWVDENLEFVID